MSPINRALGNLAATAFTTHRIFTALCGISRSSFGEFGMDVIRHLIFAKGRDKQQSADVYISAALIGCFRLTARFLQRITQVKESYFLTLNEKPEVPVHTTRDDEIHFGSVLSVVMMT